MTLRFGEQEISAESILHFPAGLPGFDDLTDFQLFHEDGKPDVHWLQAVKAPEVTFSVAEPHSLGLAYEMVLTDEECATLKLDSADDVTVLLLLSRAADGAMHIHRNGPLVVNARSRIGIQKLLTNPQEFTLLRAGE